MSKLISSIEAALRSSKNLHESSRGEMRFDLDARVEVFLNFEELEYDDEIKRIKESEHSVEEKVQLAKARATQMAREVFEQGYAAANGAEFRISAEVSIDNVNIDRIDWVELVSMESFEESHRGGSDSKTVHFDQDEFVTKDGRSFSVTGSATVEIEDDSDYSYPHGYGSFKSVKSEEAVIKHIEEVHEDGSSSEVDDPEVIQDVKHLMIRRAHDSI